MFNVLALNKMSTTGLSHFPASHYKISPDMNAPDAILVRSQSMLDMTIPVSVRVIGRAGVGVNNIPVAQLTKMGIPVMNTPGANANAVRELVIAGMLLACRNICQAWNYAAHLNAQDEQLEKEIEQNKKQFVGFEIQGKTLGVIGLGSVGVKVANAAINLGMRVIGYDPTISVNRAWELSSSVQQARQLGEVLSQADFITLHVPLIPETRHMINAIAISQMQQGIVLLNFSRDEIVDNQAVLDAIKEIKIRAYVSDFPSTSLINHPNVISLPHIGASTYEAEENCAVMIVKQVRDFLETGAITNSVNFPTVETNGFQSGSRIAIVNENIPNMVAQISSKLASANLNILSLLNKSRDEIAYTLLDVNTNVSLAVLQEISRIPGVIQVRKLEKIE